MISLHSGRIIDLATNCCGFRVLQRALDCEEDEVCLLIVSDLLWGDPATTLVNKHASYVWSKVRVVFILSNLYSSLSAFTFTLVLSFDPLSVSAFTLVPPIYSDPSLPSS
jgi:hypothetical protein